LKADTLSTFPTLSEFPFVPWVFPTPQMPPHKLSSLSGRLFQLPLTFCILLPLYFISYSFYFTQHSFNKNHFRMLYNLLKKYDDISAVIPIVCESVWNIFRHSGLMKELSAFVHISKMFGCVCVDFRLAGLLSPLDCVCALYDDLDCDLRIICYIYDNFIGATS